MKYEFKKIDSDTTKLIYRDKEYEIKKDVELVSIMESIQVKAKQRLYRDLAKDGLTVNDLQVERKEGNKTYIDKSNLISLQQDYLDIVANEVLSDLTSRYTGMKLTELMTDIGINISATEEAKKEQMDFMQEFLITLRGESSPSGSKEDIL